MRRDDPPFLAAGLAVAARLVREFEGLRLKPYTCPAGVATIGHGSTTYPDGRRVTLLDPPITEARAEEMLQHHLRTQCLPAVLAAVPNVDTANRLGALLDFVFNLGARNFTTSKLARRAAEGRWELARTELARWVYANGKPLAGLMRRRAAEADLL